MLDLKRPIVFFDIETTGLSHVKDRIIELSMIKYLVNGDRMKYYSKFNPGAVEISKEAEGKHGISLESLKSEPKFEKKAEEIFNFLDNCDLAGYNGKRFDIPFMIEELIRAGHFLNPRKVSIIDPFLILTKEEPRTLECTYKYYTGKVLENAHSAEADIEATIEIFESQISKYNLHDLSMEELSNKYIDTKNLVDLDGKFIKKDDGTICVNFGKHLNKTIQKVFKDEPGYFEWMQKGDFSNDTKIIAKKLFEKLKQI